MVGVPAQAGTVVRARVQVADALVVGEEGDAVADEHGGVQVAFEVGEEALAVQPEAAHGAAPVALPGGRFVGRGAREEEGPALVLDVGDLDVGDRAPGEPAAGAAARRDAVGPGEVGEGLAVRGDGEDVPVRGPAADLGVGAAPVGEPLRRAAVDRRPVDLGHETAPARVRDVPSVRRETRVPDLRTVDGEPPGSAGPVEGGEPEVVLGYEAQQVVAEVGQAQIAHLPMLFRETGPSNF